MSNGGWDPGVPPPPLPPTPPAPSATPAAAPPGEPAGRGRRWLVAVAVAVGALVVLGGIGLLATGSGNGENGADRATKATAAPVSSPLPVDASRIQAIVADAHSGRYFSNDHASTYPAGAETALLKGAFRGAPDISDQAAACMLSYVETKWSFATLVKHSDQAKAMGVEAGLHCVKYA